MARSISKHRPPPGFFKVSINTYAVLTRDARLIFRLTDGSFTQERNLVRYWHKPKYDSAAKCPEYDAALDEMFRLASDPVDMRRHFYEFLGYMLLPSRVLRFQWVLYGDKQSGKYEALKTVGALLGGEEDPDNLLFVEQPPARVHTDKQLARTMVIPFFGRPSIDAPPAHLFDRIMEQELSGILNRALEGLQTVIRRGRFEIPVNCQDATRDYFRTVDQVGNFLNDCCVVLDTNSVRVPAAHVINKYIAWSQNSPMRLGRADFVQEMRSRGIPYTRSRNGVRHFCGLALVKD